MKLLDTTNSFRRATSLREWAGPQSPLELADRFRLHLIGLNDSEVGSEWDSGGRCEGDSLHHIDLPLSGNRQIVHQGKVIDLRPGTAWFLPGGTPVERRCREACRRFVISFRCEWLTGVDPLLDWPERHPVRLGRQSDGFFVKLQSDPAGLNTKAFLQLHARVMGWLAEALPDLDHIINSHIKSHRRFERVFELIENQLGADLRVEDLAATLGLSASAFSMAFTRNLGISPKAWLSRRLNQEAIKLLIQSNAPIKVVARELKFADEFHFCRFFRCLNGVSPRVFRLRLSGGKDGRLVKPSGYAGPQDLTPSPPRTNGSTPLQLRR